jgi:hypothetical protein
MLGQAEYIKQAFSGILDERCRIFLIKKCLPLLPTLRRYKDAIDLLKNIGPCLQRCDWYSEFLTSLKSDPPSPFSKKQDYFSENFIEADMASYYRFAAFVSSHIEKQKFDAKWADSIMKNKIEDEKGEQPLGGTQIAGEKALQDWFIKILNGILKDTFGPGLGMEVPNVIDSYAGYVKSNKTPPIYEMDFYHGCETCKELTPHQKKVKMAGPGVCKDSDGWNEGTPEYNWQKSPACYGGPQPGAPCGPQQQAQGKCQWGAPGANCKVPPGFVWQQPYPAEACLSGICGNVTKKCTMPPWNPEDNCLDSSTAHYTTYTRILDLMLYETVKSYLL